MARRGGHGHHGGAWKVAYADFVTAMMALFIVLWILGANTETRAAVSAYFRNPSVFNHEGRGFLTEKGAEELRHAMETLRQEAAAESAQTVEAAMERLSAGGSGLEASDRGLLAQSAKEIEGLLNSSEGLRQLRGQVSLEFTSQGLRIQIQDLESTPLFSLGSAEPTARTRALFFAVAEVLSELPNLLLVEGHTDGRPYSGRNSYSNWELSGDRANSARRILEDGGIPPERIARVVGYADRRPIAPEVPFDEKNRRISIIVCYRNATLD